MSKERYSKIERISKIKYPHIKTVQVMSAEFDESFPLGIQINIINNKNNSRPRVTLDANHTRKSDYKKISENRNKRMINIINSENLSNLLLRSSSCTNQKRK